jgi:ribonuclease Z
MVDGVTAEDEKVAPIYKVDEICELLRASDTSIVKEIAGFPQAPPQQEPIVKKLFWLCFV